MSRPSDDAPPAGPTSSAVLTHAVELVEHHVIDADVENKSLDKIKSLHASAVAAAHAWLDENGMDAAVTFWSRTDDYGDPLRVGVAFDVVVGRSTDPEGLWTWSARWWHWLAWFSSMASVDRAIKRGWLTDLLPTTVRRVRSGADIGPLDG
jgi:hypothetical protein